VGRTLTPADDQAQADPVVVLSYQGWQKHCNSDPAAVGQTLLLNGSAYTIVGVLDSSFLGVLGHSQTDLYAAMAVQKRLRPEMPLESLDVWATQIMARIGPAVDRQQVRAGLDVLFRSMTQERFSDNPTRSPRVVLEEGRRGLAASRMRYTQPLLILMVVVSIVLVVACINLAGLLLARGAVRQHELAIRSAIGAGRWHLLRQSLMESLLLVLAGAGLGGIVATWGKTTLARMLLLPDMPLDITSDTRVFAFTLGLSALSVAVFGLIPALGAMRTDPMVSLKDRSALSTPRLRLGRVLVTAQVALCLLLLMGAGLFTRTLVNLRGMETGFNSENLLTFQVNARQAGYQDQRLADFYERLRESIRTLPRVQNVAHSSVQLLARWRNETMMSVPGCLGQHHILRLNVSDSYLSTMGIPLLAGRGFSSDDHPEAAKVILVNQTLARTVFPDEDPIGCSVTINRETYRIVGICGDTKYYDLKVPVEPTVLLPFRQHSDSAQAAYYQVRCALEPMSLVPAIREVLAELDPMIPMAEIKTQALQLNEGIAQERLFAALSSALALLAVLLACIGLYGLLAYNVARRTSEIGVRMAIGARPPDVARPILREAALLTVIGVATGVPVALGLARLVRAVLYGVQPHDLTILIGAVMLLMSTAALAAWIPARRAAKVDPMVALRHE